MIIGLDIDDTVADLLSNWLSRYNMDYKDTLKPADIDRWNLWELVKPECGKKIYDYLDDPTLYDDVDMIYDSRKYIELIRKSGHRVVFVTSSPITSSGRKLKWLQDAELLTPGTKTSPDYFEASDKSLFGIDVLVDDRIENINNFRGLGIIFTREHNKNFDWPYRANSWKEVYNIIENMTTGVAVKGDTGKLDWWLLPIVATQEVIRVLMHGARKYGSFNWSRGLLFSRCWKAAIRHLTAWRMGEDNDPETGLNHLAHACCEIMFALSLQIWRRNDLDDRILPNGNDVWSRVANDLLEPILERRID